MPDHAKIRTAPTVVLFGGQRIHVAVAIHVEQFETVEPAADRPGYLVRTPNTVENGVLVLEPDNSRQRNPRRGMRQHDVESTISINLTLRGTPGLAHIGRIGESSP